MNNCIYDGQGDWTLFLDRDGVINVRLVDEYCSSPGEFSFITRFPEANAGLRPLFKRLSSYQSAGHCPGIDEQRGS